MSEKSIANGQLQAATAKTSRLFFIDNWRSGLIILVVLYHVAYFYGGGASFYYMEPPTNNPLAFLVLLVFILVNQSWFMGALFLISGYFTPGSFERKGAGAFLKGRLLRLGIPLVVFIFVLKPIVSIGLWQMPASLTGITTPLTWQTYPYLIGVGPLWFRIGVFILALAMASYLVRIVVPLSKDVLGFPTLSYLPQYLSFFVLGTVAYRHNWFRTLPSSTGLVGFVTAVVAGVLLFPLAFSGHLLSLELTQALTNFTGNGQWQSAVYALWDSIFAVGMCLGVITLFRHFFNRQGRFGTFLSQHSYTVYVIHIPIVVFLALGLRGIDLEPLLKFGMEAVIAVPICFAVAYVVRKIPLASRVL